MDEDAEDEAEEDADEDVESEDGVQVDVWELKGLEDPVDVDATGTGVEVLFLNRLGTTNNANAPTTSAAVPAIRIGSKPLRLGSSST